MSRDELLVEVEHFLTAPPACVFHTYRRLLGAARPLPANR
jgi:hypothetical protein